MATPPTIVSAGSSSFTTTASPEAVSVTTAANDVVAVVGGAEDSPNTLGTPGGGGLTYTLRRSIVSASHATAYAWTAPATAAATFSVSVARTAGAGRFGIAAPIFRASDGVGASNSATGSGAPTLILETTQDNSAIVMIVTDWDSVDGSSSRAYPTVNGLAPTEVTYQRSANAYTVYVAIWTDVGPAGEKTVGISSPGGQVYSIIAVEIKGSASSVTGAASWSSTATMAIAGVTPVEGAASWSSTASMAIAGVTPVVAAASWSSTASLTVSGASPEIGGIGPYPDGETVIRLRPPGKDNFGDPLPGATTEQEIPGCIVWTSTTEEIEGRRDTNIERLTVLDPSSTEVRDTDQLRIRGRVYDVAGPPRDWTNGLTGSRPGQQINVYRVTG